MSAAEREASAALDALSEDEWQDLLKWVDSLSRSQLRALEREMAGSVHLYVAPRRHVGRRSVSRRVGAARSSSDDPDPALAARREKTRAKVAAWRLGKRELCPCCGEFFGGLDEFTGWCGICTRKWRRAAA
jgi:hypothetical protein